MDHNNMTERVKVRLCTFLACFIAIATAFVLAEGCGWQEKKSKSESERSDGERERERKREGERDTLAYSSFLARFYQSSSLPTQDPGALNSQGH